jgi:hypothetical protein
MYLTELKKEIDILKKTIVETVREEVAADRVKTSASAQHAVRQEIHDALSALERIEITPENAKRIGRLIAAIESLRAGLGGYVGRSTAPPTSEIEKIADELKISPQEAEYILYAVRGSSMVTRLETMKPAILSAIMAGDGEPAPGATSNQPADNGSAFIEPITRAQIRRPSGDTA